MALKCELYRIKISIIVIMVQRCITESFIHIIIIIVNIFYQLKYILSKALVAQWVHPFRNSYRITKVEIRFIHSMLHACATTALFLICDFTRYDSAVI